MRKIILLVFCFYSWSLSAQNISISEICTKNNNIIPDGDYNQFVDWIELSNSNSSVVNISGYFISDDPNEKSKWKFPAGSHIDPNNYLIIWADDKNVTNNNHHANFKLSSNSGFVCISDPDTNLIDMLEYEDQYEDISYGKANNEWAYFSEPTPGNTNNEFAYYSSERESPPVFSLSSGFYISNTQLFIDSIGPDEIVYYTTNGSVPSVYSSIYTGPITLNENTVIRARTFGNKLPSETISGTYFIDLNKELPVVSLIINPDFLWSDSIGIYNDNEIELRREWERHSTIQYFSVGEMKFETINNIRLFGNTAYLLPQKSLAVFADDPINFQIFDNKTLSTFDSFVMRSSSDDWNQTMFRDGLTHTIISEKLEIDYLSFLPTVLYINGEYFGIHNLREKYNEDYLQSNHGVDKDKIDFLNLYYPGLWFEVIAGSGEKYIQLLDYLYNNDITDEDVFAGVSDFLDIDNYTNYIITQIYIGNGSYNHNIKTWRRNDTIDGFKWLIFDTDRGFTESWRNDFNLIYDADTVFKRLLENVNYRNHYLQQTCSHINASFRKSYVDRVVDSLKGNIENEMPYHIDKWGPVGGISSMDYWYQRVQVMYDFTKDRKDTLLHHLNDFYNLDGLIDLHLKKSSSQCGEIYIEDILIPYSDSIHTYFKNIPITLIAKPRLGYDFVDWEGISTEDTITVTLNSNTLINARFEADCNVPDIISEDAILLKDCSPYYFENDLYVEIGATLYCQPGVEINFGDNVHLYVKGNLSFIGTSQDPIVIKGINDQVWKYIELDSGNIMLDHIILYSGEKAIHFISGGKLFVKNSIFYESDVNVDDLISGSSSDVEFINNIFYGNSANTKTDCIDCDNISSGVFSGNKFYNVTDDCIDIGTNSINIVIDHNEAYYSQSMGFSIGENSVASIFRNIVANCNGGIQVHTGSTATIVNNTIYNNEAGIVCYHYDNTPNSEGTAYVLNTIFSQNNADYALQPNSLIEISYSLSDNSILPGTSNIMEDPQFINPSEDNFHLQSTSPCIDAGDLLSELDPDNTRADIGALYFDQFNVVHEYNQIVFIYPNPFSNRFNVRLINGETIGEVELYNQIGELIYAKQNINSPECTIEMGYKGIVLLKLTDNRSNCITTKLISK